MVPPPLSSSPLLLPPHMSNIHVYKQIPIFKKPSPMVPLVKNQHSLKKPYDLHHWYEWKSPHSTGIPSANCISLVPLVPKGGKQCIFFVLKDVRANCFCASLLRTTARANSHATSCIERGRQVLKWTMIGQMAIAIALLGFNDLGRSVTPTFLFRNRFYLHLPPHCSKLNKKSMWEVKNI